MKPDIIKLETYLWSGEASELGGNRKFTKLIGVSKLLSVSARDSEFDCIGLDWTELTFDDLQHLAM